jgi:hypothetical protein
MKLQLFLDVNWASGYPLKIGKALLESLTMTPTIASNVVICSQGQWWSRMFGKMYPDKVLHLFSGSLCYFYCISKGLS